MNLGVDLAAVKARLLAPETATGLLAVDAAASLEAALINGTPIYPMAFVIPLSDSPKPSELDFGGVMHDTTATFGVVIAARDLLDATGGEVQTALRTIRGKVADALLNWSPDGGAVYGGCEWAGGLIVDVKDQVSFWQDDYTTQYIVSK